MNLILTIDISVFINMDNHRHLESKLTFSAASNTIDIVLTRLLIGPYHLYHPPGLEEMGVSVASAKISTLNS